VTGRSFAPLVAAAIGLVGALAATLWLHHAAVNAVDRVLEERLRGAGESAAALLPDLPIDPVRLRSIMRSNELEGVYVLEPRLRVVADAMGASGRRADLLRLDVGRVRRAFAGFPVVSPGYAFGALTVMTGYFPIRQRDRDVQSVLVLEAGRSFVAANRGIERARLVGIALALLSAIGLAVAATRWNRAEQLRTDAATRAARGELLSRVAAMAAHEIRNPLGVIRGTIDLMRERSGATLSKRDQLALGDIGDEVSRLTRLTEGLLDLAAERPLTMAPVDLAPILVELARATEATFPGISVQCETGIVPTLNADEGRLRQVLSNLLANAAQAQRAGTIHIRVTRGRGFARICVVDSGPGIPDAIADRLFDLYFTTRSEGTGLGLAVARSFMERHGGTLRYLRGRAPGTTTFELRLPIKATHPAVHTATVDGKSQGG